MRLRVQGEEADQKNDEQANVGPKGENRQRAVHWMADAKRADRAPRSDVHYRPRYYSR